MTAEWVILGVLWLFGQLLFWWVLFPKESCDRGK